MADFCITTHAVNQLRKRFPLGTAEDWNQSKERLRSLYMRSEPFGCQLGGDQLRGCDDIFVAITFDEGLAVIKTVLTREQATKSSMVAAQQTRPQTRRQKAKQRHDRNERASSGEELGEVRLSVRRRKRRDAA